MPVPANTVRFGPFQLDLRSAEVRHNGTTIRLPEQPFQILVELVEHPGEVVTREQLRQRLWHSDTFVDFEHGLNTAVKRLRQALGDSAENPRYIETLPRHGYRLMVPVEKSQPEAVTESAPDSPKSHRQRVMALAVGILCAIVIAALLWQSRHPFFSRVDSASPRAIAVMPFQNAGSDKSADFLRLALPDEIANSLSYVPHLSIRPFATTSKYSGTNLELQQAGREMGVTSIVTGHYLTEGDQLEVTLEAIDVANNSIIWRDTIRVSASDKIAMREQITSRVRQGLVPMLGGSSASGEARTRPKSEEAYDLYLRSIAVPHDVALNKVAIAMLERAVGIDPSYAPAWEALMARNYYDGRYGDGGNAMLERSESAAVQALALDPNSIEAAVGLIVFRAERGATVTAYAEASALVKRRPDSARAHFALGYVLRYPSLLNESAHECDTALALDRGNYNLRACSWTFAQLGQPQRAMEFARLDPGSEWTARVTALILLGQGKLSEARKTIQAASDNPVNARDLVQFCLDPRQTAQLNRASQKIETSTLALANAEPRYWVGATLSYCGQKDAALRLLKSAVEHNYCSYTALQTDPLLVNLRGTHEFSELLTAAKQCQNRFLAERNQTPH